MDKNILQQIKKYAPWQYFAFRPNVYFVDYLFRTGQSSDFFKKALGVKILPMQEISIGGYLYASKDSIQAMQVHFKNMIRSKGSKSLLAIQKRCVQGAKKLHVFLLSSKYNDLIKSLKRFKALYLDLVPFLLTVLLSEKVLEDEIQKIISGKQVGDRSKKYYDSIVYVKKFNTNTQEMIGLLTLAIGIKEQKIKRRAIVMRLKDHTKKYAWLGARNFFESDYTIKDFTKRLTDLVTSNPRKKLEDIISARDFAEKTTKEFIRSYHLSKKDRDMIAVTKEFVHLRTFRTETIYASHSFVRPLLARAAKKMGISDKQILQLSIDEIIASLEGEKIPVSTLSNNRKKGYDSAMIDGRFLDFYAHDKAAIDSLNFFQAHKQTPVVHKTLSGNTAWPGTATGKVKKVFSVKDISHVKKGDILVAVMTFPNYIPAMEKAAAFVTDEGGILCHASIIAREMKKPCIIGTKDATKLLHNGDIVEVDASVGKIKVINKA